VRKFLWQGTLYQRVRLKNHGRESAQVWLSLRFESDFADIFQVRGTKRKAVGQLLPAEVSGDAVTLAYRGLDGVMRRTCLHFSPPPSALTSSNARLDLALEPGEE